MSYYSSMAGRLHFDSYSIFQEAQDLVEPFRIIEEYRNGSVYEVEDPEGGSIDISNNGESLLLDTDGLFKEADYYIDFSVYCKNKISSIGNNLLELASTGVLSEGTTDGDFCTWSTLLIPIQDAEPYFLPLTCSDGLQEHLRKYFFITEDDYEDFVECGCDVNKFKETYTGIIPKFLPTTEEIAKEYYQDHWEYREFHEYNQYSDDMIDDFDGAIFVLYTKLKALGAKGVTPKDSEVLKEFKSFWHID